MSHRKHAAQREIKDALRDPDADTTARIEALLREAEEAAKPPTESNDEGS
jgi:hypothetical protein